MYNGPQAHIHTHAHTHTHRQRETNAAGQPPLCALLATAAEVGAHSGASDEV